MASTAPPLRTALLEAAPVLCSNVGELLAELPVELALVAEDIVELALVGTGVEVL